MEDPATWGEAEKIVDRVISERYDEMTCGLSTARRITDALREAGLLIEPPPGELAPGIRG